ncbi:MAG: enoyl-CoA hydratase/isomerase family protein [Chitinophagaceae bacterium]|jgi:2-(1,2-epoxy-1,2-dihydrophenyl)acetyl-CoA isomerase|nr:enoyl-CoA hydratase/isomerase family protein [Chitinophagaceae bacterium]
MSSILFEIKDSIAYITLNRPDKFNSFNREMALLLQNRLDECASLQEVRCVYITGNGKAFCAGQDISELVGEHKMELAQILSEHYNPIVTRIRNLPKPVIAAVNGVAAGAGANIALCCDIVVAAESASFIQAFSKIGLIPDSGGTFTLPRLIGWQKASALMMTGDKVSANEADRLGMIYKVFADVVFEEESKKIAQTIAQMPTKGLAYTKHVLNASFSNTWQEQLQLEDQYQQKAASTEDYQEGINAFLEKRKAAFTGK